MVARLGVRGLVSAAVLTSTATCAAMSAVVEPGGLRVGERVLAVRVGWLAGLVAGMAAEVVSGHWTSADLDVLAGGVDGDGGRLPAKGWMALRRLGWTAAVPDGVYVSDRVRRCAEEEAARALRLAVHRRRIVAAICATWPESGRRDEADWRALRGLLPPGVTAAEVGNRTRQVRAYVHAHGGVLPQDLPDLEAAPVVAGQVLLAAADRQLVTLARAGEGRAVLRVQLPLVERPTSRADWAWHVLSIALPPTVPPEAALCAPTLRLARHRVRVDLPHRTPVTRAATSGHRVALGVDWGVNTVRHEALIDRAEVRDLRRRPRRSGAVKLGAAWTGRCRRGWEAAPTTTGRISTARWCGSG